MENVVVLYVEDEADDLFFMRRAFDKEGLTECLRWAVDGGEAIDYIQGEGPYADRDAHPLPQLILLDLNLPVRTGFEVLEWIRNNPPIREIPVVVFSSSGHNHDRKRACDLGANDYILKPSSGLAFPETVRLLKREWLTKETTLGPS
jgi:CheY-like chemotaxis protein